jgi:hypothetical protein
VQGALNVQKFGTAAGPRNFMVTRGARSDGEHAFSAGLVAHYANRPFVVDSVNDGVEVLIVENLVTADALFSYTPIAPLQFGLRLPVTYAKGQGITEAGVAGQLEGAGIDAFGLSDPELEGKFRFVGEAKSPFTLGAALFATAPLGEATAEGAFIGAKSVTGGGRLIVDYAQSGFSAALNAGYRAQPSARVGATKLGSEALFGLGVGYQFGPVLQVMADAFGTSQLSGEPGSDTMELALAGRVTPLNSPLVITLGGGPGVIQAVGGPVFRAFVGIGYVAESQDEDEDGIKDGPDQCPTSPEDRDGYEDQDGCPDTDNDADAIPDDGDKCPNEAEDLDGFEDRDGCPERDNDRDKLDDTADRCPAEPENFNGFEDEDGCPDIPDSDADGVPDDKDKCVNEAEDTDGFEDVDGCPDLDNDGDGIPDDKDECIDQAEDADEYEDEDGCPEEEAPRGRGRGKAAPKKAAPKASEKGTEANPIEL